MTHGNKGLINTKLANKFQDFWDKTSEKMIGQALYMVYICAKKREISPACVIQPFLRNYLIFIHIYIYSASNSASMHYFLSITLLCNNEKLDKIMFQL